MAIGYYGWTWVPHYGFNVERGPQAWQITRTHQRWGFTVGVVWGLVRRPIKFPGNPWKTKPWFVLRLPKLHLPWFHVWYWRKESWDQIQVSGHTMNNAYYPARFYVGGKVFRSAPHVEHIWADPVELDQWFITPSVSFRVGR